MNNNKKISLTSKVVEEELKRVNYQKKYIKLLKNTIFTLIIVVAISTLIASFIISILEINGSSMNPTLNEGEIVIAYRNKNIKNGMIFRKACVKVKRECKICILWSKIKNIRSVKTTNFPYIYHKDTVVQHPKQKRELQ